MTQVKDLTDRLVLGALRVHKLRAWEWLTENFPEKVVERKLEQLVDRGLAEYGVSVRRCWLTANGEIAADSLGILEW